MKTRHLVYFEWILKKDTDSKLFRIHLLQLRSARFIAGESRVGIPHESEKLCLERHEQQIRIAEWFSSRLITGDCGFESRFVSALFY